MYPRNRMPRAILLMILVLLAPLQVWAQNNPARVDVSKLGPQVGERVPDFSLRDQAGRVRDLQSVMGPRGAMVVFLRSADW